MPRPTKGPGLTETMRAVRYDRYGGPEVLKIATVPRPKPRHDEVLVRVHGASVGGGEATIRAGEIASVTGRRFPRGTGNDFAGEVVAVGSQGLGHGIGDRVWGILPHGTFGSVAEYISVPVRRLAPAPQNVGLVEAAALPVVGTTVIRALRTEAALKSGDRLLIRGASGGVGSFAIQFAKAMGAEVTALVGRDQINWVLQLGADAAYDYAVTAPHDLGTFDVVLDVVGTQIEAYRRLLVPRGRLVELGFDPHHLFGTLAYLVLTSLLPFRAVRSFSNNPTQAELDELTGLVNRGIVVPLVEKVWTMDQIQDAHRALEKGGLRGKHVIRVIED